MDENKNCISDAPRVYLKILVVDDTQANLDLLFKFLTKEGHSVTIAHSGEEAIASYKLQRPEMVLMDVMMPGMNGIEATRGLRALDSDRWVPIIFLSALSHRDDMVRGLEAGGDDYLAKPVDLVLLLAKINAMQRIAVLEDKLRVSNRQLQAYLDRSERELNLARELIEKMVAGSSTRLACVELWLQAAATLGGDLLITQEFKLGDLLITHEFKHGKEYLLLADAMGHGLSAAFPLMPLVLVFSSMTRKGHPVSEIVQEMNTRLSNLLPVGNFVAVTLISWDRAGKVCEIWNGGNPPVLLTESTGLTESSGKVTRKFQAQHMALGILRGDEFDASTEAFQWSDECCLTLYSDGLADAANAAGEEFGEKGIIAALQNNNSHLSLKQEVLKHLDGNVAVDDISLATIRLR